MAPTNYLNPENMKAYLEHLKKIDKESNLSESRIRVSKDTAHWSITKELKKSQRQRKYLKYLVLPE